ncbi:MAG: 30S ribosomal protein S17 [Actinomycetia bacterium]|nr:30S ribosomal protein S17 [Actinomycetes bacterium]
MAKSDERNNRKTYTGVVISDSGDKSIVIRVDARKQHPLYGKMITTSTKLHVHDENNEAGVGDTVTVMATRPLSKMKRWRLIDIIEKAK